MKALPRAFFARPTVTVARELVGMTLARGKRRVRVVETEAYLGLGDMASHARFGPTPRSAIMFGPPGRLYVYLVYGMHHCMNVVTEKDGKSGAVLIRSAEMWDGGDERFLSGPGKLCKGLGVARRHNGLDVTDISSGIFFSREGALSPVLGRSPRIGVDYAGAWAAKPLRFYWRGHPAVSGRPR